MNRPGDLLPRFAAWLRQPTTGAGLAGIGTILTAVSGEQMTWAQATPLLVGAVILVVFPETSAGVRIGQLVDGVVNADQAVIKGGPTAVEAPSATPVPVPAVPLAPPPDLTRLGTLLDARDERLAAQVAERVAALTAQVEALKAQPAPAAIPAVRPKAIRAKRATPGVAVGAVTGGEVAVEMMDTLDVLARTLWAEARSEGDAGMEAVASVILNRAANPGWWGADIRSVCLAPHQFSCWGKQDPQYARIRSVTDADPAFRRAQDVAGRALAGEVEDRTGGADHYFNPAAANPVWARGRTPTAVIGAHRFLRLSIPPPAPRVVAAVPPAPDLPKETA